MISTKQQFKNTISTTMTLINERISYKTIIYLLNKPLEKRDIELYLLLLKHQRELELETKGYRDFYSQQEIITHIRKIYGKNAKDITKYLKTSQNLLTESINKLIKHGVILKTKGNQKRKITHKYTKYEPALIQQDFEGTPLTTEDVMTSLKNGNFTVKRTFAPNVEEHIIILENYLYNNTFSMYNDVKGEEFLKELDKLSIDELRKFLKTLFDYLGFVNNPLRFVFTE